MFETEGTIRARVADLLRMKRRDAFNPSELETPVFRRWIELRIDRARRCGRLLTDQQYADVRAQRALRAGDRARYVGPPRTERSRATGRFVLRPSGQVGTVTRALRHRGSWVVTFVPDVSPELQALAETTDVEVLTLTTSRWTELERLP